MNATELVNKRIGFDYKGKRLSGVITKAVKAPNTTVGNIPDHTLTIRGKSGKLLEVSLVNSYSKIYD